MQGLPIIAACFLALFASQQGSLAVTIFDVDSIYVAPRCFLKEPTMGVRANLDGEVIAGVRLLNANPKVTKQGLEHHLNEVFSSNLSWAQRDFKDTHEAQCNQISMDGIPNPQLVITREGIIYKTDDINYGQSPVLGLERLQNDRRTRRTRDPIKVGVISLQQMFDEITTHDYIEVQRSFKGASRLNRSVFDNLIKFRRYADFYAQSDSRWLLRFQPKLLDKISSIAKQANVDVLIDEASICTCEQKLTVSAVQAGALLRWKERSASGP
jgi:hypothetical protein